MTSVVKKQDSEAAVWLFEQLVLSNAIPDRKTPERVLLDAMNAWPGSLKDNWAGWFHEASNSVGMRSRMLNLELDDIPAFSATGASVLVMLGDNVEDLLLVQPDSSRSHVLFYTNATQSELHLSSAELLKLLGEKAGLEETSQNSVRCLVFDPLAHVDISSGPHGQITPLQRIYRLLRPEWSDIWLILVFSFVVGLLSLTTPIAVETLVNTVAFGRLLQPVVILAMILLIFLGLQGALRAVNTYIVEIIQRRLFVRVAADLSDRLPRLRYSELEKYHMPEMANRFFEVVTLQKVTSQLLLDGIGLILSTVIGMAVLAFYHPWLLGFDLFLLASIAFIIFVLGRGAVGTAVQESKCKYYMAAWLEDIAGAPIAFRTHGGHDFALNETDRLTSNYLIARRRHFHILIRQIIFALGLQAIASTLLLGLGGWLVISGELTLGQLVAAELIVTVIVGAFAKIGKHMESFYDLLAAVDKLGNLFDLELDHLDGIVAMGETGPVEVIFHDVTYAVPGLPPLIKSSNLSLNAGSINGIWGRSGEGKSTILEMIGGFRNPKSGKVTLNGFLPQEVRSDILQSRVALARSDEVFHGTIEDNLVLHRSDIAAIELQSLLKDLNLADAITAMESGLRTVLKSDGFPLTENQSSLISLARAILSRPGLLLIDGLLDSLEEEEAIKVIQFLSRPEHQWTVVIATSQKHIANQLPRVIPISEMK